MRRGLVVAGLVASALWVRPARAEPPRIALPPTHGLPSVRPLDEAERVETLHVELELHGRPMVGQPLELWVAAELDEDARVVADWGDGLRREHVATPQPDGWRPGWSQVVLGHAYGRPGGYRLEVTVEHEPSRRRGRAEHMVQVEHFIGVGLQIEQPVHVGEPAVLRVEAPGVVGPITIAVDWGDGSAPRPGPERAEPAAIPHVYERPGEFPIHVAVTDVDAGYTEEADTMVLVLPGGGPPPARTPPPTSPPPREPWPWWLLGVVLVVGAGAIAVVVVRRGTARSERGTERPRPRTSVRPRPDRAGAQRFVGEPPGVAGPALSFRPMPGASTIEVEES